MNQNYSRLENIEKKHFDKMAVNYDQNYGYDQTFTKYKIHKKSDHLIKLIKSLSKIKNPNILEVGCGTGAYTIEIAKKMSSSKIIALDISPEIIKVAKNKVGKLKNVTFRAESIYKTSLKDKSVDIVVGFYVLHHLETKKTFMEIDRILKPGGLVFFCEPNILNPLVYIIKSNKFIKKIVGDSPKEWAINPLELNKYFPNYETLNSITSEFIFPVKLFSYKTIVAIDNFTSIFSKVPLVKYFGGTSQFCMRKVK